MILAALIASAMAGRTKSVTVGTRAAASCRSSPLRSCCRFLPISY